MCVTVNKLAGVIDYYHSIVSVVFGSPKVLTESIKLIAKRLKGDRRVKR